MGHVPFIPIVYTFKTLHKNNIRIIIRQILDIFLLPNVNSLNFNLISINKSHCSHRLQPLDVTLYGPFKTKYRIAQNNWLTSHPGKTISIYNAASLSRIAFCSAFTKNNIIHGFQRTGIYPFNTDIFSEEDFLASSVTDRPLINETTPKNDFSVPSKSCSNSNTTSIKTSVETEQPSNSPLTLIRPFPKASARKSDVKRGRKRGSCRVLTDTPERKILEEEEFAKTSRKLRKKEGKRLSFPIKQLSDDLDSSDKSENFSLHDDSDISMEEEDANPQIFPIDDITENDFILTKLCGKKKILHYVARVLKKNEDNVQVQFLRKKDNASLFFYTDPPEIYFVDMEDILMKLPKPRALGTARTKGLLSFDINLSEYT